MLKLLCALLFFLPLVGCGRTITDEAHDQARHAFELGDYSRGSLLLAAGCQTLHSQSIYLLRMVNYQSAGDMRGALSMWWMIRLIDAQDDFVEVAAHELMEESIGMLFLENSQ